MNDEKTVIDLARSAHLAHWTTTSDVSLQTLASTAVCRDWQARVLAVGDGRFVVEQRLGGSSGKNAIDVVDLQGGIAFEMKASPNNTHMEFYRDIFKVLVYNRRNPNSPLRKLVFLTPQRGADQLKGAFFEDVIAIAKEQDLDVTVVAI